MTRTDQAWVEQLSQREGREREQALRDLAQQLHRVLARGFGRQLCDADRDDLVQESLLKIHEKLASYQCRSRFTTWAAAIAVNCTLAELRRRRFQHISLEDAVQHSARELTVEHEPGLRTLSERERLLGTAIREALTERQREALLAELGGLPVMEVARRLGSERGAVYKLLHDARKRLRGYLLDKGLEASDLLEHGGEQ